MQKSFDSWVEGGKLFCRKVRAASPILPTAPRGHPLSAWDVRSPRNARADPLCSHWFVPRQLLLGLTCGQSTIMFLLAHVEIIPWAHTLQEMHDIKSSREAYGEWKNRCVCVCARARAGGVGLFARALREEGQGCLHGSRRREGFCTARAGVRVLFARALREEG
jgi:hypothetical protein